MGAVVNIKSFLAKLLECCDIMKSDSNHLINQPTKKELPMKDLSRFEYLQLAAMLLPKSEILQRNANLPQEMQYEILCDELFLMAKVLNQSYHERYSHEGEQDNFELSNHLERGVL